MRRRVFVILSSNSLAYARKGFESLFQNAIEDIDLFLLTDTEADKQKLEDAISQIPNPRGHGVRVYDQTDAEERAQSMWARYPALLEFRHGHPCWHKVTDPLLYSTAGEEMIVLDPDLFFPNRFSFEPTPEKGVVTMWQRPSCLFPDSVVRETYAKGFRLAHHVDIGVAHMKEPIDLEWFNWFIEAIGGKHLPTHIMHIEAICWAALAMKMGGGYLDPDKWRCYQSSHWKRLALKLGSSSSRLLEMEDMKQLKCFHAGGKAKWWIVQDQNFNYKDRGQTWDQAVPLRPFVEMTEGRYKAEQSLKGLLRRTGYYSLINSSASSY